eukprot:scaffold126853_cov21-Phaeocystis_antarctica.AAC.1
MPLASPPSNGGASSGVDLAVAAAPAAASAGGGVEGAPAAPTAAAEALAALPFALPSHPLSPTMLAPLLRLSARLLLCLHGL